MYTPADERSPIVWLLELEADRLRNLDAVSLKLPAGLTLLNGRNGQGKTSILEAIYLLGTARSFRTRRIDDLVSWHGGPLRVAGHVDGLRGEHRLKVILDRSERRITVDDGEVELVDLIGRLDVVDLTAERMKVLRDGPDERRRFLDRGLVGIDPTFLRLLGEYRRTLQQRNALLKSRSSADPGNWPQMDAWDQRLVPVAAEIHRRRRQYAMGLGAELAEIGRMLLEGRELTLHYRPSPAASLERDVGQFAEVLAAALQRTRGRDAAVRHTTRGPHRDDFVVEMDGVDLRRFGSAGQVRAAMVALKLAKLARLKQDRGEAPIFLIDDFDSDLDDRRAAALARYLHDGGFQTVVATSKAETFDSLDVPFHAVDVYEGKARPLPPRPPGEDPPEGLDLES